MATGRIYYFGCVREAGHYLWGDLTTTQKYRGIGPFSLGDLDGGLPLKPGDVVEERYKSEPRVKHTGEGGRRLTHLRDWTVLAQWDNTVDHRGGSHSTFIAPGTLTEAEMIALAVEEFPAVAQRIGWRVPSQAAVNSDGACIVTDCAVDPVLRAQHSPSDDTCACEAGLRINRRLNTAIRAAESAAALATEQVPIDALVRDWHPCYVLDQAADRVRQGGDSDLADRLDVLSERLRAAALAPSPDSAEPHDEKKEDSRVDGVPSVGHGDLPRKSQRGDE